MARARNIKPSFFTNEDLVDLPFSTRLLFIGLWTLADREGRLEDRPKRIKMAIFPADDVSIESALQELDSAGFLLRYESNGMHCIQIINFSKHQNPHVKEAASTLPAPGEHSARRVPAQDEHYESPADSLIPETLNTETNKPLCASAPAEREKEGNYPPMFLKFWEAYPRKKAKGDALKTWKKIKPSEHLAETILQAVQRAKTSADWLKDNGQFIPYPASWLNAMGWEDELSAPTSAASPQKFWGDSWPGIEWRAKQLGVTKGDGEMPYEFKMRVAKAAKQSGERIECDGVNIRQWVDDEAA